MKRRLIFILIALLLWLPGLAFAAAGTVTQTPLEIDSHMRTITFVCTGGTAGDAGTIPNTVTNTANTIFIAGWYLYSVKAFPTSGGTAPDAADVFILDANSLDLLGCVDGSTTAYQGLNLIHATLPRATIPDLYIPRGGLHQPFYPAITGALTLKVSNQATASANWTIVLTFVK